MTLDNIDGAVAAGARFEVACETIGVQPRTLQRWRKSDEDRRVGPRAAPSNRLSEVERKRIVVSLSVTTRDEHVPVDFELYVPATWCDDANRRRTARIPDSVVFKTKPQLAVDMLRRAVADGVAPGVVLADSAYGSSSEFRKEVRKLGLDFGVGVDPKTTVWVLDSAERARGDTVAVRELAHRIHDAGGFRRCTWRKGTKDDLSARFALRVHLSRMVGEVPRAPDRGSEDHPPRPEMAEGGCPRGWDVDGVRGGSAAGSDGVAPVVEPVLALRLRPVGPAVEDSARPRQCCSREVCR